ncbi:MAG: acyl carrier protein [Balneola sp.]|nr:MAG: acyl carrier protein [Balneola sp.]
MISKEELSEKLKTIIESYIPEEEMPEKFSLDMNLTEELGINSMHVIDIIIDIENEFDIMISDEELQNMTTGANVIETILNKLKEKEEG